MKVYSLGHSLAGLDIPVLHITEHSHRQSQN